MLFMLDVRCYIMTKCMYSVSKVESIEIKPTVISKACTNLNAAARAGGLGQLTRFNGSDTGGDDDAGEHCASGGSGVPRLVGQGTRLHARSHVHVRTRVRPPSSLGSTSMPLIVEVSRRWSVAGTTLFSGLDYLNSNAMQRIKTFQDRLTKRDP